MLKLDLETGGPFKEGGFPASIALEEEVPAGGFLRRVVLLAGVALD